MPARAQAPDTLVLRLETLLAETARANPALRAARLDAEARAEMGAQVGALPDPSVSLTVFPYPVLTAYGAQRTQWRAEQRAPWPGTLALRERAADLDAETARYDADAAWLDLALAVRRAYYDLAQVQRTEALIRAFQQRLGIFVDAAATRYEVGRGPQAAVLQVSLEAARLDERLFALDALREAALQTLARLTNRPGLLRADVVAVALPTVPEPTPELVAEALRARPETRALEAATERARTNAALVEKASYPGLGVALTYTDIAERDAPPTASGRDALALTLMATLPLQRGRLRARREEARLRVAQAEAREEALATAIETEIAELAYRVAREAEALALFRDRLAPQAQATAESVLAAYTTGQATYTSVLDAERARFQISLGSEDARARFLDALARYDRALGLPAPPPR